jgi:valyl-tRNA synthetase
MNAEAGELAGQTQDEANERVVEWLREHGRLEKRESYSHAVGTCERCHTRIEPLVSLQWWVRMEEPRKPALQALRDRRVVYHPESQHQFAIRSLEDIPDWNISRQLWWGHQLPLWYCPDGHVTCAWPPPDACAECGSTDVTRDEDVLDTWFSSALWPFATLGWPDDTPDLRRYYPGDVDSTAREIIRLWVNRMIWSGLELLGDIPFRDVIIHSTVLAADGRRMSKSLGTGVDPLDVIAEHGADATRYGLLKMSSTQDVRFNVGMIEEGRKLANKLWNVSRLILSHAEGATPDVRPRDLEERWILARLDATRAELESLWSEFDFSHSAKALYRVTFDEFCDWYAEAIKPRLYEHDADAVATALIALERLLKLLHPVMPHVTEEIWSNLPARESRLIVAPWPEPDDRWAADADALEHVQDAARIFRRSGIRVGLEGDASRVFETVVKPERVTANGNVDAEIARLRGEVERGRKKLANERFVENAAPEVVDAEREKLARYERELDALGG